MSISNPKIPNPAKKFIEFKGDKGIFRWYNKEAEENVNLKLPVRFIVLDQLNTIVGYNESAECGIFSNEVHSLTEEVLSVRLFKGGTLAKGIYENISDKIKANGGRFCKVVYAALGTDSGLELVAFKFFGAAFAAWLEFTKGKDLTSCAVQIENEFTEGKKGATKYKIPVFKSLSATPEKLQQAIEMDRDLQEYFKVYKSQQREAMNQDTVEPVTKEAYNLSTRGGDVVPETKEGFVPQAPEPPPITETPDGFRAADMEEDDLPF